MNRHYICRKEVPRKCFLLKIKIIVMLETIAILEFCKSTSNIPANIPHPTLHIPNIPHPEHPISRISHNPTIPYCQHTISLTFHIARISSSLSRNVSIHASNSLNIHSTTSEQIVNIFDRVFYNKQLGIIISKKKSQESLVIQ